MTGYGAATVEAEGGRTSVTARGVNHRFLEVVCHLPWRLAWLESEVRAAVAERVARGRIEITVHLSGGSDPGASVVVARRLVTSMTRALREVQAELGLEGGVTVSDVIRFPGAVEASEPPAVPQAEAQERVLAVLREALAGLLGMRAAEGERLRQDLLSVLAAVEAATARIESLSAEGREARRQALGEKVSALRSELGVDEGRLYPEILRAVERHDIAEEIQRLRSHVAMARELLASPEACGRRLDFLAQELMREANTAGSKSASAAQAQEVVGLKNQVERFREQAQNVE